MWCEDSTGSEAQLPGSGAAWAEPGLGTPPRQPGPHSSGTKECTHPRASPTHPPKEQIMTPPSLPLRLVQGECRERQPLEPWLGLLSYAVLPVSGQGCPGPAPSLTRTDATPELPGVTCTPIAGSGEGAGHTARTHRSQPVRKT